MSNLSRGLLNTPDEIEDEDELRILPQPRDLFSEDGGEGHAARLDAPPLHTPETFEQAYGFHGPSQLASPVLAPTASVMRKFHAYEGSRLGPHAPVGGSNAGKQAVQRRKEVASRSMSVRQKEIGSVASQIFT